MKSTTYQEERNASLKIRIARSNPKPWEASVLQALQAPQVQREQVRLVQREPEHRATALCRLNTE